jgi:hypothetical protein
MNRAGPFTHLAPGAGNHLRLYATAAIFHAIAYLHRTRSNRDAEELLTRHPFLRGHLDGVAEVVPADLHWDRASDWWRDALAGWEAAAGAVHLPLAGLGRLGLSMPDRLAVVTAGLVEEDARFATVNADLQGAPEATRPTLGTLAGIVGRDAWDLRRLHDLGALDVDERAGPGAMAVATVPGDLWALLRGGTASPAIGDLRAGHDLSDLATLPLDDDLRSRLYGVRDLLATGRVSTVVLRGPGSGGRRRLLGALARALGRAAVFIDGATLDADGWRRLAARAAASGAMPVVRFDLAPGESATVPASPGRPAPIGLVVGVDGDLDGPGVFGAARCDLARLGPDQRRHHWARDLAGVEVSEPDLDLVSEQVRLPAGHIRRVAATVRTTMALQRRSRVTPEDVTAAVATLNRQRLDTLARRLDPVPGWDRLVIDTPTAERLTALERRCRHRERLCAQVGAGFAGTDDVGVRALLAGPSGTGKTLAARILAARLGLELYRVDLAAVVSKYVGETEKNLHRVLATAEELDVVLLLDEGDSLLGRRTDVHSANDRFANLETNFLLQRLEGYDGIIVVATNAADRIDPAFQRRMDVVLTLVEPGPRERLRIWELHLPADHRVPATLLEELAARAEMTGGQIRNAAMQAALLALDGAGVVGTAELRAALAVEYAKAGGMSPFAARDTTGDVPRTRAFVDALP